MTAARAVNQLVEQLIEAIDGLLNSLRQFELILAGELKSLLAELNQKPVSLLANAVHIGLKAVS